jgi:hypothetical protein
LLSKLVLSKLVLSKLVLSKLVLSKLVLSVEVNMFPRILASLSLLLAIVSLAGPALNSASANKNDYYCPRPFSHICNCEDAPNFCCPRANYSPVWYSCESYPGQTCVDRDAVGNALQIVCLGKWHTATQFGPNCTYGCFTYWQKTQLDCDPYFQNTCAPP